MPYAFIGVPAWVSLTLWAVSLATLFAVLPAFPVRLRKFVGATGVALVLAISQIPYYCGWCVGNWWCPCGS